jgi:hypothetical protein
MCSGGSSVAFSARIDALLRHGSSPQLRGAVGSSAACGLRRLSPGCHIGPRLAAPLLFGRRGFQGGEGRKDFWIPPKFLVGGVGVM